MPTPTPTTPPRAQAAPPAARAPEPHEDPYDEASEIVADEELVAATAAHLDEGPTRKADSDRGDHLTPETLLGDHRDRPRG